MSRYSLILVPTGAIVPEEVRIALAPKGDFVERIAAGREQPVIMEVSTRELQALVEYRDLLSVDLVAVIGLHGAMYNTIWNTYVSTMKRTTIDQLLLEQQAADDDRAVAGQTELTNPSTRRSAMAAVRFASKVSKDVNDDDETGTIE